MQKEKRMLEAHLLKAQGFTQKEIAGQLGVCPRTIRNYLSSHPSSRKKPTSKSKLDSFKPFIKSIINKNPHYNCEILFEKLYHHGYQGKISILRDYVAIIRKEVLIQAVVRFETEPGFQAQVDWKELGKKSINGKKQKLYVFFMALGYSHRYFLYFTTSMKQSVLHACHVQAFRYFGGVPKEILYDNMKTAFVIDEDKQFVPNKKLLSLAHHYGFVPKRCRVRRPETKGKVERGIGYLMQNFAPRIDWETNQDTDELNENALQWLKMIDQKPMRELQMSRETRFEKEKQFLNPLPATDFDCADIHELTVSRESLFSYQGNRYSLPPRYIGKQVTLKVEPLENTAIVLDGANCIRKIRLSEPGKRSIYWEDEDRTQLLKLHKIQLNQKTPKGSRKVKSLIQLDIQIRKPLDYAKIFEEGLCRTY